MKRKGTFLLVASLALMLAGWLAQTRTARIPSRGGEPADIPSLPDQPTFLQVDPAWMNDTVGGSGETISAVGCTLCCLSMAFCQAGYPTNPQRLNTDLKERDGYTREGWLKWEVAEKIAGKGVRIEVVRRPSHAKIDTALRAGHPVVARIRLWDSLPHWVLIGGKKKRGIPSQKPSLPRSQLSSPVHLDAEHRGNPHREISPVKRKKPAAPRPWSGEAVLRASCPGN